MVPVGPFADDIQAQVDFGIGKTKHGKLNWLQFG